MSIQLNNHTSAELHELLAGAGVTAKLARQLQSAAVRRAEIPASLEGVSPRVLQRVRNVASIPRLAQINKVVSPRDGFAKYLFRGKGADPFETVRIPLLHRAGDEKYVVCVSSQVGCAMGCVFCATGRMGFRRNLEPWEMVDQVAQVRADSAQPVRGVVFMGMGEPLMNYDAVIKAAKIMSEPCGLAISAKAISISTVGIVPGIRRLTAEEQPYRLVISLTSADPKQRRRLMPMEMSYSAREIVEAAREYNAATGRRIILAWTMIAGVNTREEDARQLAELTRGLPIRLDLIDVNDTTGRFFPPGDDERNAFRDALRTHLGMPVARRYSGGVDIQAACGMLAGS